MTTNTLAAQIEMNIINIKCFINLAESEYDATTRGWLNGQAWDALNEAQEWLAEMGEDADPELAEELDRWEMELG